MPKNWRFFKKFFFFQKIFFEKISRLVYKTHGRWSQIKNRKKNFFWKNPKNLKNLTKKVVNFIFLKIVPRFWFSNTEKSVPWGLRNSNLPSDLFGQAKNWTSPYYHTCITLSFLLFSKPFSVQYVWSGLIVLLGIFGNVYGKKYYTPKKKVVSEAESG